MTRQDFEDFEKNAVSNLEEIEKNRIKNFEETGIYSKPDVKPVVPDGAVDLGLVSTRAEWTALREQCTWTPTRLGDAVGFMVTGPSGNSIFLPETGFRVEATIEDIGRSGNYWSATLDTEYASYGWYLFLKEEVYYGEYRSSRFYGYPPPPGFGVRF